MRVRNRTHTWCHDPGMLPPARDRRPLPRMGHVAELKERLRADLNDAMRGADRCGCEPADGAELYYERGGGRTSARALSDEEVMKVLTREARKRREAAEAFGAAGRAEQAAAERAEGEVWRLSAGPADDEELSALVTAAIDTPERATCRHGSGHEDADPRVAGRPTGHASPPRSAAACRLTARRLAARPPGSVRGGRGWFRRSRRSLRRRCLRGPSALALLRCGG